MENLRLNLERNLTREIHTGISGYIAAGALEELYEATLGKFPKDTLEETQRSVSEDILRDYPEISLERL